LLFENQQIIGDSINLIATIPGFEYVAPRLRRLRIEFRPDLPDRAQFTWYRTILLGEEPFSGDTETVLVSLAGTLVHEYIHSRQNPLLKSWSFWLGVFTRTHPMRLFEWPAYRTQILLLHRLGQVHKMFQVFSTAEAEAVLNAFIKIYGDPPQ
jgi:hypothetical protein